MKMKKIPRSSCKGKVYLIGAGPGDPELITVKGRRLIGEADCIVYDFLSSESLLKVNGTAERIYVGKSGMCHTCEQDEINRLLVAKAKEDKLVVRLKGGDPFIFGRGGEEALELAQEGIEFEVVPGVSSAYAVPAYAGIPVTHRGVASSVAFITGHEDPAKDQSDIDWAKISTGPGTLVFLMAVRNLQSIMENLIKNGRNPEEDVALIRWGTTPQQQTLTGKLNTIAELAGAVAFKPPAIIVVGKVVSLRDTLAWFDLKPLFGKAVVVTRTGEQESALAERLIQAGAKVIEIPLITTAEPGSFASLDESLEKLRVAYYHWVIFASPQGVARYFGRMYNKGYDARIFGSTRIAVMGSSTGEALKKCGLLADARSQGTRDEVPGEVLSDGKGKNILIVGSEEAIDCLADLQEKAYRVDSAVAYKTVVNKEGEDSLKRAVEGGKIDMITFTSSTAVKSFSSLLTPESTLWKSRCASIGMITSQTAREYGFQVAAEAGESSIQGLVDAILRYYEKDVDR
jgi:uroporphyrinogen III methyltransferase / synthase